jgi:glycosyltransferase involved in cell wall biosynthesis
MIVICTNEVAGPTGYHKSVVQLANGLGAAGYPVALVGFLGSGDVSSRMIPVWPLDVEVPAFTLRTLPADGGRLLHRNVHAELAGDLGALHYEFTANELAALRELNAALTGEDTIIFTAPVQVLAFQHALGDDARRPRTVLQIHGDYRHHVELWEPLMATRGMVDRLQTVADGLREQFIPTFDDEDVVFIPNYPGEGPGAVQRVDHEGVNIALPASFQHRKNQLDAVRALAQIEDESVHLTLWGNVSTRNPYCVAVTDLVDSLGLADRVHMPGFGTEHDVYSTADIVLMTSLSEGFPYPLLEAMYQSRPTVSYDFQYGPREAIEDGGSGYIIPLGDVDRLAERLSELAADESLREQFGRRARERYDERFAPAAVAEQYRRFLGPSGAAVDLAEVFSTDGIEPVAADAISHRVRRSGTRRIHQVTVRSSVGLHDVQIESAGHTATAAAKPQGSTTRIEFEDSGPAVLSYTTAPGSGDRHYLASTTADHELEVLAHLRRDAGYGAGRPAVEDTVFAASGGIGSLDLTRALTHLAARAPRDVTWKARQLLSEVGARVRARRELAGTVGATPFLPSANPTEGADQGEQDVPTAAPGTRDVRGAPVGHEGTARSIVSPLIAVGPSAASSTMRILGGLAKAPAAGTRRELARHPWFPVTSGIDNFGAPINRSGGVAVRNSGTSERPSVMVRGEYDWLVLRDGVSQRRVGSPWSYGELFERLCAAEREHGLFDVTTADGVHVWELGRSALVIQLAEAAGLWGAASAVGGPVRDEYSGSKRLTAAPAASRVVFDYARRGQSGYRTAPFVDEETLFVVQPDAEGYPGVDESNMVFPFAEFSEWKRDWRRRWAHLRVPEVDARPFEAALSEALGIRVDLGDHLRNRLAKFLAEREFFTPVFERVRPQEVLIASSHWWAGIAAAAERSGARVSDIQYALTSRYAPSFWFGQKPHYGASRFYAWSDFWAERTNAYDEHVVVPREQPELVAAVESPSVEAPRWDVCVISQPRVLRRILAFVQELVRERPELRVVIAPHPAQRVIIGRELAAAGLESSVEVAEEDTLTTIGRSAMSVGTFSTSLWESAALGCPTFVIEVPGFEETLQDVESGLFRLARSPHDLVPYEVPASRHRIFG